MTESAYGIAQPPCSKPPRRSSSGRPGACITPSSVRLVNATILLISAPLDSTAGTRGRLQLLYEWPPAGSTALASRVASARAETEGAAPADRAARGLDCARRSPVATPARAAATRRDRV